MPRSIPVASLASAYVDFDKQQNGNLLPVLHNGSRIHVQSTSVSRRKLGIKSSCAQPSGPKPNLKTGQKRKGTSADEPGDMKIRKLSKKKRTHNLTKNIKNHLANAGPKR